MNDAYMETDNISQSCTVGIDSPESWKGTFIERLLHLGIMWQIQIKTSNQSSQPFKDS